MTPTATAEPDTSWLDAPAPTREPDAVRLRRLVPSVRAMLAAGTLHPFDGLWISGLAPGQQPAAAAKCVGGTPLDRHREHWARSRSPISHGGFR